MGSTRSKIKDYFLSSTRHHYYPGEAKLIRKIDFFILTFCCLSYFLNYLDRTNLSNAYVSGMKEDLSFHGDQLNQINTFFTIGYVLGQIPSNLSLQYIKPSRFFPSAMIVWAALTMVTASAKSPQSIMAIRFFQGIAESTTFVGTHYILGSWYTERELGKRSGIFTASGLAGTMIGGFIQSGIYSSMEGLQGLRGWRWLFIIDGIITLPVALYGFLLFPDTPATTTAFYLSKKERELAVTRLQRTTSTTSSTVDTPSYQAAEEKEIQAGRTPTDNESRLEQQVESPSPPPAPPPPRKSPFTRAFVKSVLTSYEFYGFVILWIIAGSTESFSTNALLALFLKSYPFPERHQYSVSQLNSYPTGVPAVGILSTLFFATLTDYYGGKRYLVGYFIAITGICSSSMIISARHGLMSSEEKTTAVVMAAYYWSGAVYACQATFFAWANDATRYSRDATFRGVVLASMNLGSNAVNAWWSIVFYGASMAPWFERGMWAMIASSIGLGIWTAGLSYWIRREERKRISRGEDQVVVA